MERMKYFLVGKEDNCALSTLQLFTKLFTMPLCARDKFYRIRLVVQILVPTTAAASCCSSTLRPAELYYKILLSEYQYQVP